MVLDQTLFSEHIKQIELIKEEIIPIFYKICIECINLFFHSNKTLLSTFFSSNWGYHTPFNAIGGDMILDAQRTSDKYNVAVTPIAGYSIYFTELSKDAQEEIITQIESCI